MIAVLTIGDLVRRTGLPQTTIYYYLRRGLLPRPQKWAYRKALYTEEHVEILQRIVELRETGVSLGAIEQELQPRLDKANEDAVDLVAQEYGRTHSRILAAAIEEFTAKGYKNTHVNSLIDRLGITVAVFYNHFPSKRRLLGECVSVLMRWSLTYVDSRPDADHDPVRRMLWLLYANFPVFQIGTEARAVMQVERGSNRSELQEPIEETRVAIIQRLKKNIESVRPADSNPSLVSDELIAASLFGAAEQTLQTYFTGDKYSHADLLRAHVWLTLSIVAARSKRVDIDAEMSQYEDLIEHFLTASPAPPSFDGITVLGG